jgi:hypothetical protein
MAEATYLKINIARECLDAAIEFFLARNNFFCSIHLASTAEELFGAYLPKDQRIFTLAWKAERALKAEKKPIAPDSNSHKVAMKESQKSVNEWKNEVKHMNAGNNYKLEVDPAFAAEFCIGQALINFYKLKLQKSAAIWRFEEYQNQNVGALKRHTPHRSPRRGGHKVLALRA